MDIETYRFFQGVDMGDMLIHPPMDHYYRWDLVNGEVDTKCDVTR